MPVQLTAQLVMKDSQLLGRSMTRMANKIVEAEQAARRAAAIDATRATQASFRYLRPANAPSRPPGRESTGGNFPSFLRWEDKGGQVQFDVAEADARVWYWIILEIGTGNSATIRRAGTPNPVGRPAKGSSYVRSVKAQYGRRISSGLVWGTGPRGTFTAPGAARGQQLYLRASIKKAPVWVAHARRQMYITQEIKPQNFVRTGGTTGFLQYRASVLAAARRTFAGRGYRP